MAENILVTDLLQLKRRGLPIVAITAYDFPSARLVDAAGVDLVLVGDSLGTVVQGNRTTIPVTVDQIIYHSQLVSRGVTRALVVADMPFLSYQVGADEAVLAAGRLLKEGLAGAVKLEGGRQRAELVRRLVSEGIAVMGHIGLLPQSHSAAGGYKVQGRTESSRQDLKRDAAALEEAGAFSIVLEGIPSDLAAEITAEIAIPTIGIGAGAGCSGQILVFHDLLGLSGSTDEKRLPKFVKQYLDLDRQIFSAVSQYAEDVRTARFPEKIHSYN